MPSRHSQIVRVSVFSTVGALLVTGLLPAGSALATTEVTLSGIVRTLAADTVSEDHGGHHWTGHSEDVYRQVLLVGSKSYFLKGKKARNNARVQVKGQVDGNTVTASEISVTGTTAGLSDTGTSRVLVMLATWTAPDAMTQATAANQLFSDTNGWYRAASYGALGQAGDVTPWLTIAAPTTGCYNDSETLMIEAKNAAAARGYVLGNYDNFVLYFPNCQGDAAGYAGWAHVGAPNTWLNGYMDRRVSVHEQGHNYGLWHSHSYMCSAGGLSGSCAFEDYGDLYDAMGSSGYVGHFNASQKTLLGWMSGRTVDLSSGGTATLVPYEGATTAGESARINTATGTTYWLEYRQPINYDSWLPSDGTDGVLVHVSGTGSGSSDSAASVIDVRPADGVDPSTATLRQGSSWTTPEGIKIAVGSVTSAGAAVTVSLPGQAVVPSAPTSVTATAGNASAKVSWTAPASDGGAAISMYTVTSSPGGKTATTDGTARTATVAGLTNSTSYTFTVRATNAVGTGPTSSPSNSVRPTTNSFLSGAPIAVTVSQSSSTAAKIVWSPPTNPGDSFITGYRVSRDGTDSAGGGPYATTVSSTSRSFTMTKLVSGRTYNLWVQAINAAGASRPVTGAIPLASTAGLAAPSSLTASQTGGATVTLKWQPPTVTAGKTITGYKATRLATATTGAVSATVAATARSYAFTGLANGTTYDFTIQPVTSSGAGPTGKASATVKPYLSSPTSVTTAQTAAGAARISWAPPSTLSGQTITAYRVFRNGTNASDGGPWVTQVSSSTRSFTFTRLAVGTTYTLSVQAITAGNISDPVNASRAITY